VRLSFTVSVVNIQQTYYCC